eukprot:COSAG02_NODE_19228_length_893_cov_2.278338_1_plen_40_part_01
MYTVGATALQSQLPDFGVFLLQQKVLTEENRWLLPPPYSV